MIMKKCNYILVLLVFAIGFTSCRVRKIATYPTVSVVVRSDQDGSLTVRCSGIGTSENAAVTDAEKKAINTLLFIGYLSSTQIQPLVDNEQKSKNNNVDFYDQFLEKGGYKSFIMLSSNYSKETSTFQYKSSKLQYYLVREIQINLRSLRSHLEQNKIIPKFGLN